MDAVPKPSNIALCFPKIDTISRLAVNALQHVRSVCGVGDFALVIGRWLSRLD